MICIISCFPGLGRVDLAEERLAKPSLADGQTRLVGKVVCSKCGKLSRKFIFSTKAFLERWGVSVIKVLHVQAQATGASFELLEVNFQNTNITYALEFSWSDYETQLMLFFILMMHWRSGWIKFVSLRSLGLLARSIRDEEMRLPSSAV